MDVQPFTPEETVWLDLEGDYQVPRSSAPAAAFTFSGQADLRPAFDTPRHRDLESSVLTYCSAPATSITRGFWDLPAAKTRRARPVERESSLAEGDRASAFAFAAFLAPHAG